MSCRCFRKTGAAASSPLLRRVVEGDREKKPTSARCHAMPAFLRSDTTRLRAPFPERASTVVHCHPLRRRRNAAFRYVGTTGCLCTRRFPDEGHTRNPASGGVPKGACF